MSDTPETEIECFIYEGDYVPASFARKLERERDESRKEVERLKSDAELYAGWSKWKDGIWCISQVESGPCAEWIAEDLQSAMKGEL